MTAANQLVDNEFIHTLRKSTSIQHSKLESTHISKALLSHDVTIADYINYLLKMREIIAYCEFEIFPLLAGVIPDIEERRKLHLINNDINNAEIKVRRTEKAYQPLMHDCSIATALGFMYVIEGSTLGGRVILKHLHNKLNLNGEINATFFAGYKTATGNYWTKFMHELSLYVNAAHCKDEVIVGAKIAFDSIYYYFEQPDTHAD